MKRGNPLFAGSQVYLRPLEKTDLNEQYLAWLNDPEVTRYLGTGVFPTTRQDLEQFFESVTGSRSQVILAIVDKKSDRHIGNVMLGPNDWVNRRAVFGILIGEKKFWGRVIGQEVPHLAVEYAFLRLNLNRVGLGVFAEHTAGVRCYEKIGFRKEGLMRQDLFRNGEYHDRLWVGLLRSEYLASQKGRRK